MTPILPPPAIHGGDGTAVARAFGIDPTTILDLSQSLNPLAPDPMPVVVRHLSALRHYPETTAASGALAAAIGVEPERLLITNGGAEAIALVAAELGGHVVEPDFALHPRQGGPLWRSNPHNPSGLLAPLTERADVWDEAFFPLATGCWTRGEGVVVGSLTKLLACPGLRLGYVLGDPELVARCRDRQPAWSVGSVAAAALPELISQVDLPRWCAGLADLRDRLVRLLASFGLNSRPSDANWVLVEHGQLRAALAPHGVVVRDCANFGLPHLTRIAVPSEAGLGHLAQALEAAGAALGSPAPYPPGTGSVSWRRPVPVVGDTSSARNRREDPRAWSIGEEGRNAFYSVIRGRRDIRRFRPDQIDAAVLERILSAAHAAPSVGHSQPWRFVVVRDSSTRDRAALMADREWHRQAAGLSDRSGSQMLDLQLHGIRDAPLGVVVCCDRRTAAQGVLGRATFVDADLWSCACAIENLWLAARAEGVGVGWVTLFRPEDLGALVCAPPGVETLGWLCLGWPDERPPEPGLERAGWSSRQPLSEVVLRERWPIEEDAESPPPPASHLEAPTSVAVVRARDDADVLLTPAGSLGVLDRALDRLAALGLNQTTPATFVLVAAGHPVTSHGVSVYDVAVTREVFAATIAGESLGAVAARQIGAVLFAVDAGVPGELVPGAVDCRPQEGRGDLVAEDAMTLADVERMVGAGRVAGQGFVGQVVALGEVGIGNTTVAAALVANALDLTVQEAVGLGAGGDSATLARKKAVVSAALVRAGSANAKLDDPLVALAALGGPEIAYLTGVTLGAAEAGALVVLDGLVTSVAALSAATLEPAVAAHLVAGQESREDAHRVVNAALGIEPLLSLRLRAGEGVGALLAIQMLRTAAALRAESGRVVEVQRLLKSHGADDTAWDER